jgi:hypothetical protein
MSKNINQVFIANPITTNADTDLMYFGQSPYGVTDDAAMTYLNFKTHLAATFLPLAGGTMSGGILSTGATPANDITVLRSAFIYLGVGASQAISPVQTNFLYEIVAGGVNLSDASGLAAYDEGFYFAIKNISGTTTTFTPNAPDTIDGAASLTLQDQEAVIISKGSTQWSIVSKFNSSNEVTASEIQNNDFTFAADTGAANAYVLALSPALTAYQEGQTFSMKIGAGNTNTSLSTININGLGGRGILTRDGSPLSPGMLVEGRVYDFVVGVSGTLVIVQNPTIPAVSLSQSLLLMGG